MHRARVKRRLGDGGVEAKPHICDIVQEVRLAIRDTDSPFELIVRVYAIKPAPAICSSGAACY